jgi:hypothetical protein
VIPQSIHEYFFFGTCVRYLQDVQEGHPLRSPEEKETSWFILGNLEQFFKKLDELNLQVTKRGSWELKTFYEELSSVKPEEAPKLTKAQAVKLNRLLVDVRKLLDAELPGFQAYIVTPKRLDVQRLLKDVSGLLAAGTFKNLDAISRMDLEEAGKCIAFERSTAAAFHLLRGTEAVLRQFYCGLVKQHRVSPMLWGNMIIDLRKRHKAKPHHDLIEHLDHIRRSFRNPTQHPEKMYDMDEVQDLWSLCTDAISRMAKICPAVEQVVPKVT